MDVLERDEDAAPAGKGNGRGGDAPHRLARALGGEEPAFGPVLPAKDDRFDAVEHGGRPERRHVMAAFDRSGEERGGRRVGMHDAFIPADQDERDRHGIEDRSGGFGHGALPCKLCDEAAEIASGKHLYPQR